MIFFLAVMGIFMYLDATIVFGRRNNTYYSLYNRSTFSPRITVAIGSTASGFPEYSQGMVKVNLAPSPHLLST